MCLLSIPDPWDSCHLNFQIFKFPPIKVILIHLGIVESHPDLLSFSQKRYCSEVKNRKKIYQNGYITTDKENTEIVCDFSVLVRVTGFEPAAS